MLGYSTVGNVTLTALLDMGGYNAWLVAMVHSECRALVLVACSDMGWPADMLACCDLYMPLHTHTSASLALPAVPCLALCRALRHSWTCSAAQTSSRHSTAGP